MGFNMISWSEDRACLSTYYDAYKPWLDFLGIEMSMEEFKEYSKLFESYKVMLSGEYIGCMLFEPKDDGVVFHMAVLPEFKGRWAHHWVKIKKWMLERYGIVYGATHATDRYNSRILSRAGFKKLDRINNFDWWKLWP